MKGGPKILGGAYEPQVCMYDAMYVIISSF